MMKFEEIQKVWNEQKGENMYVINESTLHKTVVRKKNAAGRRINRVETMLTIINSTVLIVLIMFIISRPRAWTIMNAAIVATSVIYIRYFRLRRKQRENTFDRNILGELDHAISNTDYIIRFNYLVMVGYLVPMAVVTISSLIATGASPGKWLIITGMCLLAIVVVRWEQRICNIPRKNQLLELRKLLTDG